MSASRVFVVSLLVFAASLASLYSSQRTTSVALARLSVGIGTVCLLGAVALVGLSIVLFTRGRLADIPQASIPEPSVSERTAWGTNPLAKRSASVGSRADGELPNAMRTDRHSGAGSDARRGRGEPKTDGQDSFVRTSQPTADTNTRAARETPLAELAVDEPWAATECVVLLRRDPAEDTRWTIENDCSAAVAIVIATCSAGEARCYEGGSRIWRYERELRLLPAKRQRTIIESEQIVRAEQVQEAACAVTSEQVMRLIGMDPHAHATAAWRNDLAIASQTDGCLALASALLDQGRHTGVAPNVLRGDTERVSAR